MLFLPPARKTHSPRLLLRMLLVLLLLRMLLVLLLLRMLLVLLVLLLLRNSHGKMTRRMAMGRSQEEWLVYLPMSTLLLIFLGSSCFMLLIVRV